MKRSVVPILVLLVAVLIGFSPRVTADAKASKPKAPAGCLAALASAEELQTAASALAQAQAKFFTDETTAAQTAAPTGDAVGFIRQLTTITNTFSATIAQIQVTATSASTRYRIAAAQCRAGK